MRSVPANTKEYEFVNCRKIIVLQDDENVIITTEAYLLHGMIKKEFEQGKVHHDLIKLTNLILKRSFENVVVYCTDIIKENLYYPQYLEKLIVGLLQKGNCTILNKKTLKFVDKVEVEYYDYSSHEMISEGGRNFHIDSQLIINYLDYQT